MVFGTIVDPLSPFIAGFCILPVLLLVILSVAGCGSVDALGAQCILACGTFGSLRLLNRYPMVNPVHAVVLLFHWWFGFGPSVCAVFWLWKGESARADAYLTGSITPTLIVALGVPIYAFAARLVLYHWKGPELTALSPHRSAYEMSTLLCFAAVAAFAGLILQVFGFFGLRAYDTVNYLGGQVTEKWWLIPFAEAGRLVDFATAIACSLLAVPNLHKRRVTHWVMFGVALVGLERGLTSGSKGPLVFPVLYFVIAFVNWRRRVPWLVVLMGLCGYFGIVEPFVATMRSRAERLGAMTTADRQEIFGQGWREFQIGEQSDRDANVETLFRGIYPLAKEIADQSAFMDGPWKGQSLRDGFSALLPRALFPDKADSNMGNFFARQLSVQGASNYYYNIAITIPFEVVGNYGWLAGWASFAVLGVLWASVVAMVLTVPRMTTHPLTPYFIAFAMAIESSVGQFGNSIKTLAIPLALLYFVCQVTRTRANHTIV